MQLIKAGVAPEYEPIEIYPDDIFSDGFESGNLSAWSRNHAPVAVRVDTAHKEEVTTAGQTGGIDRHLHRLDRLPSAAAMAPMASSRAIPQRGRPRPLEET